MTTHTLTNLEKIRQACIKANPRIMELKFGCRVEHKKQKLEATVVEGDFKYGIHLVSGNMTKVPSWWVEKEDWKNYKILGRDIRLADVLLALDKVESISSDGQFYLISKGDINNPSGIFWNLKDDNLSHQSPETLQFLADLL